MTQTKQKIIKEEQKVKCPHLMEWQSNVCNAVERLFTQLIFNFKITARV